MRASGHGPARHSRRVLAALLSTQSLSSRISPDCSAIDEELARGQHACHPAAASAAALRRHVVCRVVGRDLRLEMQLELAGFHRLAQRLLGTEAAARCSEHLRAVHAEAVAAQLFGSEQRRVRRAQQGLRIAAVIRTHRNANTGAHEQLADARR